MPRRVLSTLVLALWALGVDMAAAQPEAGPPPGSQATPPWALRSQSGFADATRITLEVAAQREVNLDMMQAVLSVEADDNNLGRLADTMKQKLEWGVRVARESPFVQVDVRDYRAYPIYDRYDPYRFDHWWATQELRLGSKDFAALNRVLGNLQGKLLVRSVTFNLSAEARREAENSLVDEALSAFKERAQHVQKNLNAADYRIITLEVHIVQSAASRSQTPRPYAGTEQVAVALVGSIELK